MLWNMSSQSRIIPCLSQILRHCSSFIRPPTPVSFLSERPAWPCKPRRSLALDQSENPIAVYPATHPGLKEENEEGVTYLGDLSPSTCPTTAPPVSEGDEQGAQLVFLDMAQNIVAYDITSWCLSLEGSSFFLHVFFVCSSHVCTQMCVSVFFHQMG